METFVPPQVDIPTDEEGYLVSFAPTDLAGIQEFFRAHGFAVVRDVLTPEECAASVEDIWAYLAGFGVKRDDTATWVAWPRSPEGVITRGEFGLITQQLLATRQHPTVYQVFAAITGRPDLLVSHDRYILFRPSKGVEMSDGKVEDHPEWRTVNNLHLDMNPIHYATAPAGDPHDARVRAELKYEYLHDFITENNAVGSLADGLPHVFGLLNFVDNRVEDGGFQLVPDHALHFERWVAENREWLRSVWPSPDSQWGMLRPFAKIQKNARKVPMRAGSMVVWDQRTVHGSHPNQSNRFRYVQPLKMFPAEIITGEAGERRAAAIRREIERLGWAGLTPLGARLFGLEPWPAAAAQPEAPAQQG